MNKMIKVVAGLAMAGTLAACNADEKENKEEIVIETSTASKTSDEEKNSEKSKVKELEEKTNESESEAEPDEQTQPDVDEEAPAAPSPAKPVENPAPVVTEQKLQMTVSFEGLIDNTSFEATSGGQTYVFRSSNGVGIDNYNAGQKLNITYSKNSAGQLIIQSVQPL